MKRLANFECVDGYSIDEWLQHGSGKHGEDLCDGSRQTCNGQPGMLMNKAFQPTTPN